MQEDNKTVRDVMDALYPHWEQVKKTIDLYPEAFVMCYNEERGYHFEVSIAEIEKQLESKRHLFKMANGIQKPKAGSFMDQMEYETLARLKKESEALQDVLFLPHFNTLNLSDFQSLLHSNDYAQETIQEITNAIESYQSTLTAKRIALKSLSDKIAECKELAQIVYGKEIKVDIVFNHE